MKIYNPRQVVLVSTRFEDKDNVLTVAWHSPASFNPKLYIVFIGKNRFSCELIKKAKRFCVNFMSKDDEGLALTAGRSSGKDSDKFEKIKKEECEKIDCPRLKDAVAFMECEIVDEVDVGDHIMFVGKVINEKILKEGGRLYQVEGIKFTTTVI